MTRLGNPGKVSVAIFFFYGIRILYVGRQLFMSFYVGKPSLLCICKIVYSLYLYQFDLQQNYISLSDMKCQIVIRVYILESVYMRQVM